MNKSGIDCFYINNDYIPVGFTYKGNHYTYSIDDLIYYNDDTEELYDYIMKDSILDGYNKIKALYNIPHYDTTDFIESLEVKDLLEIKTLKENYNMNLNIIYDSFLSYYKDSLKKIIIFIKKSVDEYKTNFLFYFDEIKLCNRIFPFNFKLSNEDYKEIIISNISYINSYDFDLSSDFEGFLKYIETKSIQFNKKDYQRYNLLYVLFKKFLENIFEDVNHYYELYDVKLVFNCSLFKR